MVCVEQIVATPVMMQSGRLMTELRGVCQTNTCLSPKTGKSQILSVALIVC